jgi:hypothetical protein
LASGHKSIEWGCSKCKGEAYAEQDWKRASQGCLGVDVPNLAFEFAPELKQCPWSQIDSESQLFISWYQEFEEFGILPFGSESLLSEPAYILEAFQVMRSETKSVKQANQKRAMAEAEHKRRG